MAETPKLPTEASPGDILAEMTTNKLIAALAGTRCAALRSAVVAVLSVVATHYLVIFLPGSFILFDITASQFVVMDLCMFSVIVFAGIKLKLIPCSPEMSMKFRSLAEFCGYLAFTYACSHTSLFNLQPRPVNGGVYFVELCICLLVAGLFSVRQTHPTGGTATAAMLPSPAAQGGAEGVAERESIPHIPLLNRNQTEEWKGWMQMLFLWYHYLNYKVVYNAIRLFIACYVWMTGFGNFSYYYVRRDFSFGRFFQMMWRLNFFVLCTCVLLRDSYMLYYICPLHTLYTLMIYVGLGIGNSINTTNGGVAIKFGILLVVSIILWDLPFSQRLFGLIWAPFGDLFAFAPSKELVMQPGASPELSEWFFRSYLDHLIWIVGMLMAFFHPNMDAMLVKLESMTKERRLRIQVLVFAATSLVALAYYFAVYTKPKSVYVVLHPYTSFIPIVCYVIFRNLSATLRNYRITLYEFLGKITLETYITQFHIWLATVGPNESPKFLLRIFPRGFVFLDFAVLSLVAMAISYRVFHTSGDIRTIILPSDASKTTMLVNMVVVVAIVVLTYMVNMLMM